MAVIKTATSPLYTNLSKRTRLRNKLKKNRPCKPSKISKEKAIPVRLDTVGDELVLKFEKKKLIKAEMPDLAALVKKMQDGKGYDTLSFFPDKREKHIEVKTATTGYLKPFPIS